MTPKELIRHGQALYGERWQTPLAQDLGITDRTMRRWLAKESEIPVNINEKLRPVMEKHLAKIGGLLAYTVNAAERIVIHYPTNACFEIKSDDELVVLFDKLVPPDKKTIVLEGAYAALRQERERIVRSVGKGFFWAR